MYCPAERGAVYHCGMNAKFWGGEPTASSTPHAVLAFDSVTFPTFTEMGYGAQSAESASTKAIRGMLRRIATRSISVLKRIVGNVGTEPHQVVRKNKPPASTETSECGFHMSGWKAPAPLICETALKMDPQR